MGTSFMSTSSIVEGNLIDTSDWTSRSKQFKSELEKQGFKFNGYEGSIYTMKFNIGNKKVIAFFDTSKFSNLIMNVSNAGRANPEIDSIHVRRIFDVANAVDELKKRYSSVSESEIYKLPSRKMVDYFYSKSDNNYQKAADMAHSYYEQTVANGGASKFEIDNIREVISHLRSMSSKNSKKDIDKFDRKDAENVLERELHFTRVSDDSFKNLNLNKTTTILTFTGSNSAKIDIVRVDGSTRSKNKFTFTSRDEFISRVI